MQSSYSLLSEYDYENFIDNIVENNVNCNVRVCKLSIKGKSLIAISNKSRYLNLQVTVNFKMQSFKDFFYPPFRLVIEKIN